MKSDLEYIGTSEMSEYKGYKENTKCLETAK